MGVEEPVQEVYFNPWDEAFRANPYPHYKALYDRPPVLLNLFMPMALVKCLGACLDRAGAELPVDRTQSDATSSWQTNCFTAWLLRTAVCGK